MRWIMIFATTLALSACGSSNTSTSTPDRTQPSQQEKAADVKTEAAGEHFQNGMSQPDQLMQSLQKEAPTAMQQAAKPEAMQNEVAAVEKKMQESRQKAATTAVATAPKAAAVEVVGTTWRKCAACHNFTHTPKVGPGLAGVIGRKAGTASNFHYKFTKYIKGKPWVWDEAHLKKWMCNSKEAIKTFTGDPNAQTKMPVQRVCSPEDQKSVLSKLKSIS